MAISLKLLGVPLAGAGALLVALTAISSPVDARRGSKTIGKIVAGAAATTAVKVIARKARADTAGENTEVAAEAVAETKSSDVADKPVDHAARTKALLDAENKVEVQVVNGSASGEAAAETSGEISCYAGCNPVPATPPRTIQSLREQHKSR